MFIVMRIFCILYIENATQIHFFHYCNDFTSAPFRSINYLQFCDCSRCKLFHALHSTIAIFVYFVVVVVVGFFSSPFFSLSIHLFSPSIFALHRFHFTGFICSKEKREIDVVSSSFLSIQPAFQSLWIKAAKQTAAIFGHLTISLDIRNFKLHIVHESSFSSLIYLT